MKKSNSWLASKVIETHVPKNVVFRREENFKSTKHKISPIFLSPGSINVSKWNHRSSCSSQKLGVITDSSDSITAHILIYWLVLQVLPSKYNPSWLLLSISIITTLIHVSLSLTWTISIDCFFSFHNAVLSLFMYSSYKSHKDILKCNSDHITSLFKTLQWFPITYKIQL